MGASSALKYGKADIIVADSPFRSIKKLCKEVVVNSKPKPIPSCLISCIFPCVYMKLRSDVKTRGQYDLDELDIEKDVEMINPASTLIFLSGNDDKLVNYYNSQKLYRLFSGKNKYLEIVVGNHNSKRPDQIIEKIMGLIERQG